jgi:mannose-1-phosphate guanylyltransferase
MKAFLLAAGLGTRLRPITNSIPKCLVPISGKPLLQWWFELLEFHKVDEVLINLHYFADEVRKFAESYQGNLKIHLFYEDNLLGSAGTLRANKEFVKNEESFFILYADNLTDFNLSDFLEFHNSKKMPFSMALFRAANPQACGIATLDSENIIVEFTEKPKEPKSDLANAGIYIASPEVLELIPELNLADIGFHLLPQLEGKMAGLEIKDYLIDIGTLENLSRAEAEWPTILRQKKAR